MRILENGEYYEKGMALGARELKTSEEMSRHEF
jgi:hypothetical protein